MLKENGLLEIVFDWMKKYKYIILLLVVIVASSGYYYFIFTKSQKNTEEYVVLRKDLNESISLTGRVQASNEANLSFEKTGVVRSVSVVVGQNVGQGDILATLSGDDANGRVQEAQAALLSQKALLEDMTTGARVETIDIKKAALDKAENDLRQAYKNAGDSLKNTSISGNTYVRDNLATSFTGNLNNGYQIVTNTCDSIAENNVSYLRGEAEKALLEIERSNNDFSIYDFDSVIQSELLSNTKNTQVKKITQYLDALKNLFSLQCVTSNSSFDSTRTLVSSSRTAWSAVASDLSLKLNLIETAKTNVSQAKNDLQIAQSGEKSEKVKQQEANVAAAAARLTQANAEANKNLLRSPFTGVVTNIDIKLGELVTPGGKSISMISESNFQIESKVSEVDVAKLVNGANALITFDTYGDSEKFEATVTNISPAGIITDGVPTYKTIFVFTGKDDRIRSGMTANINVVTNIKENVLSIPAKFITIDKADKKVIVKLAGGKTETKIVKTGVRGTYGEVEILEGLSENDVLVTEKK